MGTFLDAGKIERRHATRSASAPSVTGIGAALCGQIVDQAPHHRIIRPANQRCADPILLYETDDNKGPAVVRQS
jgi:hypothetical protein